MRKPLALLVLTCTLLAGLIHTTAWAKQESQTVLPSQQLFDQRLQEQQESRAKYWETHKFEWPNEKYVIQQDVDGLPGRDYATDRVAGVLSSEVTLNEALEAIAALETVELTDVQASFVTEEAIGHQFCFGLTIREGFSVQDAIDELWECPQFVYAAPDHYAHPDGYLRGDTSEFRSIYSNPEEAEQMLQAFKDGEISAAEWRKYVYDNLISLTPGTKPKESDYYKGSYSEDHVAAAIAMDSPVDEVLAALSAMRTVEINKNNLSLITEDRIRHNCLIRMDIKKGFGVFDAIDELWDCPYVAYACPDITTVTPANTPQDTNEVALMSVSDIQEASGSYVGTPSVNDPLASSNDAWWLSTIGAQNAWSIAQATGTVSVAVIDTGFDATHPDLQGVLDMAHAYNSVDSSSNISPLDDHGTHVAGIIAAEANNELGIAGVSYNARIVPVKAYETVSLGNTSYIDSSDLYLSQAYQYILSLANSGDVSNLSVVNISHGSIYALPLLHNEIQSGYASGLTTVCAGGSYNGPDGETGYDIYDSSLHEMRSYYPSDYEECISVTSVDQQLVPEVNGQFNGSKDIAAPGVNIYSTLPGSNYGYMTGTSMSTPMVSGTAALLYAFNPILSAAEVRAYLENTATDLEGTFTAPDSTLVTYGAGRDSVTGAGLLNATVALEAALDDDCTVDWDRQYGTTRYDTAAAVSAANFDSSDKVVIASGTNYPDALSAVSLAGRFGAPVLTVGNNGLLSASEIDEIQRLGATYAYIVGGPLAIPTALESQLQSISVSSERVYGIDRHSTCVAVSNSLGSDHSSTAIIANGFSFADALSVGFYACASKSPIFLTAANGTLTQEEINAINVAGYQRILLVGGPLVVNEDVRTQLAATGRQFYRVTGDNRYQTSVNVARWATGSIANALFQPEVSLSYEDVFLATGTSYADSLGASAAAGHLTAPLLLVAVSTDGVYGANVVALNQRGVIERGHVVGGPLAVPTAIVREYMVSAA